MCLLADNSNFLIKRLYYNIILIIIIFPKLEAVVVITILKAAAEHEITIFPTAADKYQSESI